jgi:hypothetical protein
MLNIFINKNIHIFTYKLKYKYEKIQIKNSCQCSKESQQ